MPVVMIGPGTGVAPMRSMIHQRQLWATQSSTTAAGRGLEGDVLIFGCRSAGSDYFFHDEWTKMAQTEGLDIITAFSRETDQPKKYVQDRIREHGSAICMKIIEQNGKIYLSGSSGNMPKGVREALTDILVEQKNMGREEAEKYLDQMERDGRFKQETW